MSSGGTEIERISVKFVGDTADYKKAVAEMMESTKGESAKISAALEDVAASLKAVANAQKDATNVFKTANEAQTAATNATATAVEGMADAHKKAADEIAASAAIQKTADDEARKAAQELNEAKTRASQIIQASMTPSQRYAKGVKDINDLQKAGHLTTTQHAAALRMLNKELAAGGNDLITYGNKMRQMGTYASIGVTAPLVAAAGKAIMLAGNAAEVRSKFDVVYAGIGASAQKMANELDDAYGMSSVGARDMLANTGDLISGFGFSRTAALELSGQINKLAVDQTSFKNYSGGVEGASQAITKALLGEREMLKGLGIALSEEDIAAQVMINTSKNVVFETERQAKAYATLQLIKKQSANAAGDFQRTEESFANQLRDTTAELEDLGVAYGELLLPVAAEALGVFKETVVWLKDMDDGYKSIVIVVGATAAAVGPLLIVGGAATIMAGHMKVALIQLAGANMTATVTTIALRAAMVGGAAVGIAIAAKAAYDFSLKQTGLNEALERGVELSNKMGQKKQAAQEKVFESADKMEDPGKKSYLEKQHQDALKNMEGIQNQQKGAAATLLAMEDAWHVPGDKLISGQKAELEEIGARAKEQSEYVARLRDAIHELTPTENGKTPKELKERAELTEEIDKLNKKLQVEIEVLQQVGLTAEAASLRQRKATDEEIRGVEQKLAVIDKLKKQRQNEETIKGWGEEAAVIGMTARQAAIYKMEMKGAEEATLLSARAMDEYVTKAELTGAIVGLNKDLDNQAEMFGLSSAAAAIHKLELEGATEAELAHAKAVAKTLEAKEVAAKASELEKSMKAEAETFGMVGHAAEIYKLKQDGATASQIARLHALQGTLTKMEEEKKLMEEEKKLMEEGKTVMEKYMDPLKKLAEEKAKLHDMSRLGAIDDATLNKALADAEAQATDVKGRGVDINVTEEQKKFLAMQAMPNGPNTPEAKSEQHLKGIKSGIDMLVAGQGAGAGGDAAPIKPFAGKQKEKAALPFANKPGADRDAANPVVLGLKLLEKVQTDIRRIYVNQNKTMETEVVEQVVEFS